MDDRHVVNEGEELRYLWKTSRHVFVLRGDLVVQIRGEAHSIDALDAQHTGLRLARAQHRGGVFGALLVIEPSAPAPTGHVAKRQRELVATFRSDERVYICLVLEGGGPLVALKRTLARSLFAGERMHICGTVREGARWLASAYGDPNRETDILAFVDSLRTR